MKSIIWREFKTLSSSMVMTVFHFITPLFLLIFFATVFASNISGLNYKGTHLNYVDFFLPGLVGYVTFMTFQMVITFIRHDRFSGILDLFVLSHGSLNNYIFGKIFSQTIINILKVTFLIFLAKIISGASITLFNYKNFILFTISLLLGTVIWLCFGLILGLLIKRDDLREVIVAAISMPIIFSSSMYYDISHAPSWIRSVSVINPLTYTCDLLRDSYALTNINLVNFEIIILIGITLVTISLSFVICKIIY